MNCGPCSVCGHCWPLTDDSYKCPQCKAVENVVTEPVWNWIKGVVAVAVEKHEESFLHNKESES